MKQYQDLVRELIEKYDQTKTISGDRTGVGTVKVVGRHLRFNLADGFPQLTLKKTVWKSMIAELLWFMSGSTDNNVLESMGCKFWRPWAVTAKDIVLYYVKVGKLTGEYARLTPKDDLDWNALLDILIQQHRIEPGVTQLIGQLGPIYSKSWVDWEDVRVIGYANRADYEARGFKYLDMNVEGRSENVVIRSINQIRNAVDLLKNNPNSRRIIINAWDPRHIPEDFWSDGSKKTPQENVIEGLASLAFCHAFFQFVTEELSREERIHLIKQRAIQRLKDGEHLDENDEYWEKALNANVPTPTHRLNCLVTIRSSDTALGLPVNIASYALLLHMFAQVTNMTPGELIINTGDSHLYANQIEPMRAILEREPLPLPTLRLNPEVKDIFQFKMEDISLDGYEYHPEIRMDVAV